MKQLAARARNWNSFAIASILTLGLVSAGTAVGTDHPLQDPQPRFEIRAVRIDLQAGSVIYRLESATGEICAFAYPKKGPGQPHGCLGRTVEGPPGRFTLQATHGSRGTAQSSAYRLDRTTGDLCRFRLSSLTGAAFEAMGCVTQATDAAPH